MLNINPVYVFEITVAIILTLFKVLQSFNLGLIIALSLIGFNIHLLQVELNKRY